MVYPVILILNGIKKIFEQAPGFLFCIKIIIIFSFLFFTVFINAGQIESNNERIIKAVFTDDLKPWIFINDKNFEGVYPAIIRELAEELNISVVFMQYPIKRCEMMMEKGEADLIIGMKDTVNRKKYIEFLKTPYRLSSSKVLYKRIRENIKLNRFEDLRKFRIGTKLGTKYFPEFDDDKSIEKEEVNSEEQNFYKLIARRIDALIIPEDRGEYLITTLNLRDKVDKAYYQYPDGSPRYIGISKKSPYIREINKMNTAMSKIDKSGVLETLYMKHFFKRFNINVNSFRWR